MNDQEPNTTEEFEKALQEYEKSTYVLRLYIAGNTPKSNTAIMTIKKLCEERLQGRYRLEVVDIQQQPGQARGDQIIATPTLIKKLPPPLRKVIGDLSKTERIIVGLDLREV